MKVELELIEHQPINQWEVNQYPKTGAYLVDADSVEPSVFFVDKERIMIYRVDPTTLYNINKRTLPEHSKAQMSSLQEILTIVATTLAPEKYLEKS